MSVKEQMLESVRRMPDNVTWTDIEETVRLLAALEAGITAANEGRVHPHAEVKEKFFAWIRESSGATTR